MDNSANVIALGAAFIVFAPFLSNWHDIVNVEALILFVLHLFQGAFTDQHFDQDLNFLATEEDPVTKKVISCRL